ncbi:MAG: hypothetical protein R3C11_02600 [Planctomycetaceae bacterium]
MRDQIAPRQAYVDVDRLCCCGFTEVVYCEGKSIRSVVEIFKSLSSHGQHCLGTRVSEAQATVTHGVFSECDLYELLEPSVCPVKGKRQAQNRWESFSADSRNIRFACR